MAIIKYNQCLLTQLLDDAPCGGALTQLIFDHGLTLTSAQQLNLVGPGGSVGNMCGENSDFVTIVENVIIESKLEKLRTLLENNPDLLLEDCLDGIPDWNDLLSFVPGQQIIDILNDRGHGDWGLQTLQDAPGVVLNVDYFDLTIEQFPNGMNAEDFFDFVRLNFGMFDDGCISEFSFLDQIDQSSWNSDNPLGTIFSISIPGNAGSVITSQYDNSPNTCFCWTFTTIFDEVNGNHPVSGNRQFGLIQNDDGTWSFYIRGVDRTSSSFLINSLLPAPQQVLSTEIESALGFTMADNKWNCIMENLSDFINNPNNGGIATEIFSEHIRPDLREDLDLRNRILNLNISDILECINFGN